MGFTLRLCLRGKAHATLSPRSRWPINSEPTQDGLDAARAEPRNYCSERKVMASTTLLCTARRTVPLRPVAGTGFLPQWWALALLSSTGISNHLYSPHQVDSKLDQKLGPAEFFCDEFSR
jgi:hypothetical protein